MIIKDISKVCVNNASLQIHINIITKEMHVSVNYTCPECGGYGCSSHGSKKKNQNCNGGSVKKEISLSELDVCFEKEQAENIREMIQFLHFQSKQSADDANR